MISAVIPLYNKARSISRAIQSVLSQTCPDFELIVVDDGSTDGSLAVAQSHRDPRLQILTQENGGVSAARNAGVAAARFSVVALLDADDLWQPRHLEDLLRLAGAFPQANVYATAYRFIFPDGAEREVRLAPIAGRTDFLVEDYFRWAARSDPPVNASSVAFSKAALEAVGGFPIGVRSGEDLITWARLIGASRLAYCREPSSNYFVLDLCSPERSRQVRMPAEVDHVAQGLRDLRERHPALARSIDAYLAGWLRMRGMAFFEVGAQARCVRETMQAIGLDGVRARDVFLLAAAALPTQAGNALLRRARSLQAISARARATIRSGPLERA